MVLDFQKHICIFEYIFLWVMCIWILVLLDFFDTIWRIWVYIWSTYSYMWHFNSIKFWGLIQNILRSSMSRKSLPVFQGFVILTIVCFSKDMFSQELKRKGLFENRVTSLMVCPTSTVILGTEIPHFRHKKMMYIIGTCFHRSKQIPPMWRRTAGTVCLP